TRAAIHEHRDTHGLAAGFAHDIETLDYPAAARHDILDHEHRFARGEGETAAEDQDVIFLFRKNVTGLGPSRDFLSDDESAHGRGEHGVEFQAECAHLFHQQFGEALHRVH